MKKTKTYRLFGKTVMVMMVPLMVFLLFSCPVKRSLLSSFDFQNTTENHSVEDHEEEAYSYQASLTCSSTYLDNKKESFQSAALSGGNWHPIATLISHYPYPGQTNIIPSTSRKKHTQTQVQTLPIFLKNQSFLI